MKVYFSKERSHYFIHVFVSIDCDACVRVYCVLKCCCMHKTEQFAFPPLQMIISVVILAVLSRLGFINAQRKGSTELQYRKESSLFTGKAPGEGWVNPILHALPSPYAVSVVQPVDPGAYPNASAECNHNNIIRVSTVENAALYGTCWLKSEWRSLFADLPREMMDKYRSVYTWICDADCVATPPLGMLVLAKSRSITKPQLQTVTVLPVNNARHYHYLRSPDKLAFRDKKPMAIWRGTTTGINTCWRHGLSLPCGHDEICPRYHLITRWGNSSSPLVDVGISQFAQSAVHHHWPQLYPNLLKPKVSIETQLQYRYFISVEGNDIATNLKWALGSNSVVLMPHPRVESFFGEGQLRPYVHYIPLKDDTSDLLEQIEYCEAHLDFCESVSKAATTYAYQFKDVRTIHEMGVATLLEHLRLIDERNATKDSLSA